PDCNDYCSRRLLQKGRDAAFRVGSPHRAEVARNRERGAGNLNYRELCDTMHEAFLEALPDNWISQRSLDRNFGRRTKFQSLVEPALKQLEREGRIVRENRVPSHGGKTSPGWRLVD